MMIILKIIYIYSSFEINNLDLYYNYLININKIIFKNKIIYFKYLLY